MTDMYLGGEAKADIGQIIPRRYSYFFDEGAMLTVLLLILIVGLLVEAI